VSYCRQSPFEDPSDVYVYAGDCGWQTHVATARYEGPAPIPAIPDDWDLLPTDELLAKLNAQMDWLKTARAVPLGVPSAGESYGDDTPGECADRLEALRATGVRVPQSAIETLRAEQAQLNKGPHPAP